MAPPPVRSRFSLPWIAAILVGLPVVAVGLALLTGSIEAAVQILFFSVICTLGIGALFWLGLALVLGLALLYALDQIARLRGRSGGLGLFRPRQERAGALPAEAGTAPGEAGTPPGLGSLATYVSRRLAQGGEPQRIRRDLLAAGWSAAQVEAVLRDGPGD